MAQMKEVYPEIARRRLNQKTPSRLERARSLVDRFQKKNPQHKFGGPPGLLKRFGINQPVKRGTNIKEGIRKDPQGYVQGIKDKAAKEQEALRQGAPPRPENAPPGDENAAMKRKVWEARNRSRGRGR